LLLIAII